MKFVSPVNPKALVELMQGFRKDNEGLFWWVISEEQKTRHCVMATDKETLPSKNDKIKAFLQVPNILGVSLKIEKS